MDLNWMMLAVTDSSWLPWIVNLLKVIFGLGMVIFVHELGHFLVAKMCGVRCDKFYIGFDFFGLKLFKCQWGETEYGIGIFPIGGYVKMLGQEDNPARLHEELERAKAQEAEAAVESKSAPVASTSPEQSDESHEKVDVAEAEQALFDPRSYLSKSVPQRMAIISAGVIMNVVFTFLVAMLAYSLGVTQTECAVGHVVPGSTAWKTGVQPGDKILEVGGNKTYQFRDLRKNISLGDIDGGVPLVVQRPGFEEPIRLNLTPDLGGLAPTIGVAPPSTTTLLEQFATIPGSAAAAAKPALEPGDQIIRIGGDEITFDLQFDAHAARNPEKGLSLTVRRTEKPNKHDESHPDEPIVKTVDITVPPQPIRHLGLVMAMGPIVAIQTDSPADETVLEVGDRIVAVDGVPVDDPMRLPDELRKCAKEASHVSLSIIRTRDGKEQPVEISVEFRPFEGYEQSGTPNSPISIPELGIAYTVLDRVEKVIPNSPASKAKLKSGDQIVHVLIATSEEENEEDFPWGDVEIDLTEDDEMWPYVMNRIQSRPHGSRVTLTLQDKREVTLEPADAEDWFNPDRGFLFTGRTIVVKADSTMDALKLGAAETWDVLTIGVRTIRKLGSQQVSPKAVGGPVLIFKAAIGSAAEGMATLLMFLAFLSANLAVLNILPIPVLDGGHLVFLAYEGIRGKPPSEKVHLALSYLGLLLLLALMIWVFGLDLNLISRK